MGYVNATRKEERLQAGAPGRGAYNTGSRVIYTARYSTTIDWKGGCTRKAALCFIAPAKSSDIANLI